MTGSRSHGLQQFHRPFKDIVALTTATFIVPAMFLSSDPRVAQALLGATIISAVSGFSFTVTLFSHMDLALLWRVRFSPEGRGERTCPGRGAAHSGSRVPVGDPAKVVLGSATQNRSVGRLSAQSRKSSAPQYAYFYLLSLKRDMEYRDRSGVLRVVFPAKRPG